MKDKIFLGRCGKNCVFFDAQRLYNSHVTILGKSGAGKSVAAQKLLLEMVEGGQDVTVLAFNAHDCLNRETIYEGIRKDFLQNSIYRDLSNGELKLPLFEKTVMPNGRMKSDVDIVMSLTDALSKPFALKSRQRIMLRKAIEQVMHKEIYHKEGIAAIGNQLLALGDDVAENVYDKMYGIFGHNIFVDGNDFITQGKINIVDLSYLDSDSQAVAIEVVLSQLWNMALSCQIHKYKNVYVFIDEVQNIKYSTSGMLSILLSEGRKFGINLILATQVVTLNNANPTQRKMLQSGLVLYFQPSDCDMNMIAKMIDPKNPGQWVMELRFLNVGEYIVSGPIIIDGVEAMGPITVSGVDVDKADISAEVTPDHLDTRCHFVEPPQENMN
ncbi:MAG: ATP-binding protein [Lachnospiraceae bacterium]|nr:ATP-binding protein [Lachnospiraceae bacterium]